MDTRIRVALVEDNVPFREGLRYLLSFTTDFECVGEYTTGKELLKDLDHVKPHVILMDIELPDMNGLDCTAIIKAQPAFAHIHIIMLTVLENENKVLEAIVSGASGYLLKQASPESMLDAIRQVQQGGSPMSPTIARKVLGIIRADHMVTSKEKIQLNLRETQVLEGLVAGLTYKMIGDKYCIALDTVRTYIRSIYDKLQVHSRSEAIVKALRNKLV
ncbi:MAG: response regulator transcription factor [Verrucomicrobia bacterium]|nr:response regulator transcription factor [Cytophagales bacterium]